MQEIDSMDMLAFLHLRAWKAKRNLTPKESKRSYIDQVWPGVKP